MKINKLISASILTVLLTSCLGDNTDTISSITHYPNLKLIDNPILYVEKGTTYNEPGIRATLDGLTVPYEISGHVDTRVAAVYDLTYTAENSDGSTTSISRKVFVYENNETLAGIWQGTRVQKSGGPVLIATTDTPNIYYTSGFLGGYYEYGSDLGSLYRCHAFLEVNGNEISSDGGENTQGFWSMSNGIVMDHLQGLKWTVSFESSKLDLGFDVELTKIKFDENESR